MSFSVKVYNDTLSKDIWNINSEKPTLNQGVRLVLLKLAKDFIEQSDFNFELIDVVILGSIAGYNWSDGSDIDTHILVDTSKSDCDVELSKKAIKVFSGKWNAEHDINIKKRKVEMNYQDISDENESAGIFSLIKNEWVKVPEKEEVNVDQSAIQKKYTEWKSQIDSAMKSNEVDEMKELIKSIASQRDTALHGSHEGAGQFSIENLAFKVLRSRGILSKLKDKIQSQYDKDMSIS